MKRYAFVICCGLGMILGLALLAPSGCAGMSPSERDALLAQTEATLERTAQQRDRYEAELAAARAANDSEREDQAQRALDLLNRLEPMLRQGQEVFMASVGADGQINVSPAAAAIGGAVGGPVGAGLAVGLPLLASLISALGWYRKTGEARENLEAGQTILTALDRQFLANPAFNTEANKVWDKIESDITPKARELTAKMIT